MSLRFPHWILRLGLLTALWLLVFGGGVALMPLTMERGYDVGAEKLKAVLMAPVSASFGVTGAALDWGVARALALPIFGTFVALFAILGWFILFAKCRRLWFVAMGINLLLMILGLIGYLRLVEDASRGG